MSEIRCCDNHARRKRTALRGQPNGIDYVRIDYAEQRIDIFLFEPARVGEDCIAVTDPSRNVRLATMLQPTCTAANPLILHYATTAAGPQEGHTYRITLLDSQGAWPPGFDPRFSEIEFIYNKTIGSEVDFQSPDAALPSIFSAPDINYLAKDYASFRQLLLDRLSLTMPRWQETHAADLGMTLVELLAFVGDQLSYQQDAVATESYLSTARRRESVRRHARLVDYKMHEGCNAKCLLHVGVARDIEIAPEDVFFTTEIPETFQIQGKVHAAGELPPELYQHVVCFEPSMLARGDWRITVDDVKVPAAIVALSQAIKRGQHIQAIQALFQARLDDDALQIRQGTKSVSAKEAQVTAQDVQQAVRVINRLIESRELDVDPPDHGTNDCDQRSWTQSLRFRNRAILDRQLRDYLSSARLDNTLWLYEHFGEIELYTWNEEECSLPVGATSATLKDAWGTETPPRRRLAALSVGDFLLLEEVRGPKTGLEADADKAHRQIVRLTKVRFGEDPAGKCAPNTAACDPVPLVEIEWDESDKLKFPLCISSRLQPASGCGLLSGISVARGNIVPVDHGRRVLYQDLGTSSSVIQQTDCGDRWNDATFREIADRFRPVLRDADLTYAYDRNESATKYSQSTPSLAVARIELLGIPGLDGQQPVRLLPQALEAGNAAGFRALWHSLTPAEQHILEDQLDAQAASDLNCLGRNPVPDWRVRQLVDSLRHALTWQPRFDLLKSGGRDRHFVVENDEQRTAHIRFGDSQHGRQPTGGTRFFATYRSGNGVRGNVGADSISHAVFRRNLKSELNLVRNPLAAAGGLDPESIREAVLYAPHKWLIDQPRAALADDYQRLVREQFAAEVQNARATIHWVGAYYLVEVAIDRFAAAQPSSGLAAEVETFLNRQRRIGHRVRVLEGTKVPIALGLTVCVTDGYRAEDVRAELVNQFSNRQFAGGKLGMFHPDRLTFGQSVYGSQVVQEARRVPGVHDVRIDFLRRCTVPACDSRQVAVKDSCSKTGEWRNLSVVIGDLEVAQLDNSGERNSGFLCLNMRGWR